VDFLLVLGLIEFLANVNSSSCSLYVVVRPSVVCLSVTLVHPTQAIEIFGSISTLCGTLAIHNLCIIIFGDRPRGTPPSGELNTRGVAEVAWAFDWYQTR